MDFKSRGRAILTIQLFLFLAAPAVTVAGERDDENSIHWAPLLRESLFFLGAEHTFRVATDPGVREGLKGSFVGGYADSVANIHGWSDGDPFLVNYVGHPMQGAVAGDIFIHNDPRYRKAEFGRNRAYWTSRARAVAFAWAYSEQFELGPLSEASIGHDQGKFPQQGLVDHVITPVIGGAWMIAEDALDRFVIRKIEDHTRSPLIKVLARGILNPSRTFANCMELQLPWNRETRGGFFSADNSAGATAPAARIVLSPSEPRLATFEFSTSFGQTLLGVGGRNLACSGGGGTALFNLSSALAVEAEVSGCKMLGLEPNLSGDALMFAVGPRFSYRNATRWTPWVNVLAGGEKLTQERFDPALKAAVLASKPEGSPADLHDKYTTDSAVTGFRLAFGGGVDWDLNKNVGFRVGNLEYSRVWLRPLNGETYSSDLRVTMGLVLRFPSE